MQSSLDGDGHAIGVAIIFTAKIQPDPFNKYIIILHALLAGLLQRKLASHGHLVRKGGITFDLMIGRIHEIRPR